MTPTKIVLLVYVIGVAVMFCLVWIAELQDDAEAKAHDWTPPPKTFSDVLSLLAISCLWPIALALSVASP